MHRTFGMGDWQQLHTLLTAWKENLGIAKEQLAHVASTQVRFLIPVPTVPTRPVFRMDLHGLWADPDPLCGSRLEIFKDKEFFFDTVNNSWTEF